MTASAGGLPWVRGAAICMVLIVGAVTLSPLRNAGFFSDDWGFVSMARFIDSPLLFYVGDHSSTYVYRPNGMLFWWLTVAIADNSAVAHYAFNAAVHLLNAAIVVLVAARFASIPVAGALGLLFAVHPIGVATTSWLSDRYDLLATLGVLWAIAALERSIGAARPSPWLLPAWLLAIGSKETGLTFAVYLLIRILVARPWTRRQRIQVVAAMGATALLFLAVRYAVLTQPNSAGLLTNPLLAAWTGTTNWLGTLPLALGNRSAWVGWPALLVLLAIWSWGLRTSWRDGGALLAALASMAAIVVVQSPITQLTLPNGALENPVNFRFFYLAFGLMLLSIAITASALSQRGAAILGSIALAGAAAAIVPSHRMTAQWAASTAIDNRPALAAIIEEVGSRQFPRECRIHVLNAGTDPDLPGFLDNAVRASLAAEHSAQSCIIIGMQAPWLALPDSDRCTDADWAPLVPRQAQGKPVSARDAGGFCMLVLADPDPSLIASDRLSIVVDMGRSDTP